MAFKKLTRQEKLSPRIKEMIADIANAKPIPRAELDAICKRVNKTYEELIEEIETPKRVKRLKKK